MSKLQNNYTTPEQSKRLLELGVPAWTADCFFGGYGGHPDYKTIRQTEFEIEDDSLFKLNDHLTPCWSVGRLIEIIKICSKPKEQAIMAEEMLYCKDLVELLVYMIEANKQVIDFSKLEE